MGYSFSLSCGGLFGSCSFRAPAPWVVPDGDSAPPVLDSDEVTPKYEYVRCRQLDSLMSDQLNVCADCSLLESAFSVNVGCSWLLLE